MSWKTRAAVTPERLHCRVETVYGYKADRSAGRLVSVSLCTVEEQPGQAVEGELMMKPYGMATLKLTF